MLQDMEMNRSKNPSSPLDMTLPDLVEKYREATEIFNRYNEKAGECILCHSLFEPLKTVIEKYGLDEKTLLAELASLDTKP